MITTDGYTVMSRTDAGLYPVVLSSSGTPRPMLAPGLKVLTGHYTGANVRYAGKDTAAVLRNLNLVFATTKPNEYNYCVDQQGVIWEYAGDYMAAHSLGNNATAIGCLILVGIGERPTDGCVLAFRQLRYDLIRRGRLAADAQTIEHRYMGTTVTQCPGYAVEARPWSDFLVPWTPGPPADPTPVTDQEDDDDMRPIIFKWAKDANNSSIAHTDQLTYWSYFTSADQYYTAVASGQFVWDNRGTNPPLGRPFVLNEKTFPELYAKQIQVPLPR